jgi:hypothetical protein
MGLMVTGDETSGCPVSKPDVFLFERVNFARRESEKNIWRREWLRLITETHTITPLSLQEWRQWPFDQKF